MMRKRGASWIMCFGGVRLVSAHFVPLIFLYFPMYPEFRQRENRGYFPSDDPQHISSTQLQEIV